MQAAVFECVRSADGGGSRLDPIAAAGSTGAAVDGVSNLILVVAGTAAHAGAIHTTVRNGIRTGTPGHAAILTDIDGRITDQGMHGATRADLIPDCHLDIIQASVIAGGGKLDSDVLGLGGVVPGGAGDVGGTSRKTSHGDRADHDNNHHDRHNTGRVVLHKDILLVLLNCE